jgi:formylglycine-generating enzyme required for sulfatase activity
MTRNRSILLFISILTVAFIAWPNWPSVSSHARPGQNGKDDKGSEVRRPRTTPTPRPRRPVRPVRPANTGAEELLFWNTIKDSKDPADFNAYLTRYGEKGKFALLAHNRLNAIAAERGGTSGPGSGTAITNVPPRTPASGSMRNSLGIEFVAIAAASFTMGSPEDEAGRDTDESPQHRVTFARGFQIGKYEVTQEQWRSLMGTDPSKFADCDECPVDSVSWNEVQSFMAKLNARNDGFRYSLPTEAQFEYVMRGGTTGMFAGSAASLGELGWYKPNSGDQTHPVGQKQPNRYGIYDLHGNVQEWTQDVYAQDYDGAPTDGSARTLGPEPIRHVIRGGSWEDLEKYYRSAFRVSRPSDDHNEYTGFRVMRMPVAGLPTNSLAFEFAFVRPASFMMGSPEDEADRQPREGPQHQVRFARGFYMGKYEVTQEQWQSVMGANPSKFAGCPQCPVDTVSWDDIQLFLTKLNARNDGFQYSLPSEAQFEFALRGGTTGAFAGELDDLGWYGPNSGSKTHPVGMKAANLFGIYDLHGNVQEWCQDVMADDYAGAPADGSARTYGPTPVRRVIRGGSWVDGEVYFRSAFRVSREQGDRNEYNGFRLVRTPVR